MTRVTNILIADDIRAIGAGVRELIPQRLRVLQMLGTGLFNKQIGYELRAFVPQIKIFEMQSFLQA